MNARILLLVGALALGLVALFWFLGGDKGASPRGAAPAEERSPAAQPGALEGSAELDAVQAPSEPAAEREQARRAFEEESRPARTWAAEETRWVELRLVAPAGTPAEEQAEVVALEKGGDYASLYGKDGPVAAWRAKKPGAAVPGVLAVAAFERGGTARIGLPPDAEQAWFLVAGHYLYSLEARQVELPAPGEASEAVELRPVLGARISGRLLAPAGSPAGALAGVELELDWSINAALQLGASGREELELETASDGEGRFEFRAVPVGKPQTLTTRSSLARLFSEDLAPAAGEHLRLELALFAGGAVRGRVVDDSGAPIAGCEVEALGREFFGNPTAELRSTESDAEGRFALDGLTPGKVWLHVEHTDHQELLSTPFELGDGESREHGDIVLSEGLAVSGSVAFPDGAPAAGTLVSVQPDLSENLAGSPMDPRAYIGASNTDRADERGAFRITGLGAGPWIVAAELESKDAEGARAIGRWSTNQGLVRPPATDLRLTLEPPVTVSGTVLDGQRRPVAKFSVHAQRAGSQWYMPPSETKEQSFESADGRFLVTGLRSGSWSFQAVAEGYAKSEKVALELPVKEDRKQEAQLALVLLRPVLVAGTVVDPDGHPVAGAEVTKELEGTEAILAMQGRSDWPVAQSDDEGAFRLEGVAPGASSIFAKKDGFAPSEGLSLELGEGEQKLDLVLRLRRGGTISGEVYGADGKPASRSMVIVQMPTLEQRRFASTDARGAFSESGLKPGMWQVQAFPGIESLQSESGEPIDQGKLLAALKMTSVTLEDGEEEHVVLGAPPEDPVRVHGRVSLDGEPVPGAMISFVPADGGGLDKLKIETTDGEGRYELQLDAPGDHLVTVQSTSAPGRQNSIEFRRTVPKGEEAKLDLELPLGRISGRVEDSHGKPVSGARVTVTMQGGLVFGTVFGGNYTEAATDATGVYAVPWLRPGSYTVAAGGAFLGGAFGDGAALGREVKSVELREGESVRGVDFRLEQPGSVHGTVRDAAGNLVAEASIFLRDEEGRLIELFSLASTNASGTFEYPGLAPGDYVVTARTRTLASAASVPVSVRSDESAEVTLVLQPGTLLLVSLEDASGADIPSRVSVLDDKGRELNGMLGLAELMERYSGGLGDAVQRVGPLPAGTYDVRAIAEDGRTAQRSVSLSGQPERKLKLRLK